ncbi:MAG: hypothetical protein U0W24_07605 [Bacteroidales bacterium]
MDRREFILSISRYSFLVILTLIGGYLAFRPKSKEECNFDFVCKSCRQNHSCTLDEALKYRAGIKL